MDIVDGDQYRPACRESSEGIQERHRDGSSIRRSAIGFLTEQCDLERSVLRGRQDREGVIDCLIKEVPEPRVA